ncbi:MAG: Com family DNA-binding transcriptional regulator [Burkholderiaceae bacterium]|nr:Com family DNA-binding transcriptional regulator [Burkholderiaceae bacterium]
MKDIRCGACSRKLGVGEFARLVIKCPRCGAMNSITDSIEPRAERPDTERPRASSSKDAPRGEDLEEGAAAAPPG